MAEIIAKNLSLKYPVFGGNNLYLKHTLLNITTGGRVSNEHDKTVTVQALSDVSFTLGKGDRLALIGHNGSGKTTLLRVLAGVYHPTAGSVVLNGSVGTMLELSLGMVTDATGYENIRIRGMLLGYSKKEIQALTQEVEEFTEIGNFLSMPVHTYSSGMMVRLSFALSTLKMNDILLIDESVGAGDARFMVKAEQRIKKFVSESDILVLASHSVDVLKNFCNKALWLEHGAMRAYGDLDTVLSEFETAMAS